MEPSYTHYNDSLIRVSIPIPAYTEKEATQFQDDGIWLISCSFSIWTMVSGFGLLESGRVSSKDEVNIMVKNVVDVVFGGLSYWMFGFGFTYGKDFPNPFIGVGLFFFDPDKDGQPSDQAWHYARFFFQMSFATTTSTIVSAAMAERIRLKPYIVITYLMTLVHSITAHWVWSDDGFLYELGVVDAAGCSVVHLVGGVAGLASTLYLKPRQARFGERGNAHMSNPTNALLGTFMLWWGWLAFNTGSTLGVANNRWRLASRSAMVTLLSSIGGGCTSIIISLIATRKCQIDLLIDGLLASLVATTAGCHSFRPFDSLAVGAIGAALALSIYPLVERLEIDDPVGVIPVHVVGATWGMLCVGIFSREDNETAAQDPRGRGPTRGKNGLLYSGTFDLLYVQALCVVCVFVFSLAITFLSLVIMNQFPWGLRMTKYEEQLGADLIEHGLAGHNIAKYSIEKKLNVKNAYSVIKFVAKWKRKARLARERKHAELAAQRAQEEPSADAGGAGGKNSIGGQTQPEQSSTGGGAGGGGMRLGPLKLGALRRTSNFLGSRGSDGGIAASGTLSARPKSGRVPIEKEKNSLPPMHSGKKHHHQQLSTKTSLDLGHPPDMANGIPPGGNGNGSIPTGNPMVAVTSPSPIPNAHEQQRFHQRMPPLQIREEDEGGGSQRQTGRSEAGSTSIIGRFRRGARVSPRREEIPLQEQRISQHRHPPQSPRLPPLSSRSIGGGGTSTSRRVPSADADNNGTSTSRRNRPETNSVEVERPPSRGATAAKNPNDSVV